MHQIDTRARVAARSAVDAIDEALRRTRHTRSAHRRQQVSVEPRIVALQRPTGGRWTVCLEQGEVETTTSRLLAYGWFARVVRGKLGVLLAPKTRNEWCRQLSDAMRPLREARR